MGQDSNDQDKLSAAHGTEPLERAHPNTEYQHIWYITGPAGCGKSTVAQYIATALKLPFLEGDNVSKERRLTRQDDLHASAVSSTG